MATFPEIRDSKQDAWCLTWYALPRETETDLRAVLIHVGTYATESEAERRAEHFRTEHAALGGRFIVQETGYLCGILADDAKYERNKSLLRQDQAEILAEQKAQIEAQHRAEEKARRQQQERLEAEQKEEEDPTSLEAYTKLHVSRRTLEQALVAQQSGVAQIRMSLQDVKQKLAVFDLSHPTYQSEWRSFATAAFGDQNNFVFEELSEEFAAVTEV